MPRISHRKPLPRPRGFWWSALLFICLLLAWWGALTLLFIGMFDNFLYRISHPFNSGFGKGPWGFLLIYAMLSIPVIPVYNSLEGWIKKQSRSMPRGKD